jgi:hypothetical protein
MADTSGDEEGAAESGTSAKADESGEDGAAWSGTSAKADESGDDDGEGARANSGDHAAVVKCANGNHGAKGSDADSSKGVRAS